MAYGDEMFKTYPGAVHPLDFTLPAPELTFPFNAGETWRQGPLAVVRVARGLKGRSFRFAYDIRDDRLPGEVVAGGYGRRRDAVEFARFLGGD